MRLLLAVALASQITAPTSTLSGDWVGPLIFTYQHFDKRGAELAAMPTRLTLEQRADGALVGHWNALPPNTASGDIKGKVAKDGRITVSIEMRTDAGDIDGKPEAVEQYERCIGEARFTGILRPSGLIRWDSKIVEFGLAGVRAQQRSCSNSMTDLSWLLQRR